MKVLVLLSLVAICFSAQLNVGKRVTVREDGTVSIVGDLGRETYIYRNIINPRKVDIVLWSPMGMTRKIEVDETNNVMDVDFNILDKIRFFETYLNTPREQITQADILAHLFRQYEGMVDERSYQIVLEHIHNLVNSGLLHHTVSDVMSNLEHLYMIEELKKEQQMVEYNDVMENALPKMMENGVGYVHQVRDVIPVEEVVPEYLRTLLNSQENLKYRNFGTQGLWNLDNLSQYQQFQMLLQQVRQQRQVQEALEKEPLVKELLNKEYIHQQLMEQRLGQTQMTPLARLMYNMRQQQGEETLTEKLMEQRLGQTQMTPLARLMYNMRQQQGEETLTEKLMEQRLGQTQMTPLARLMYNMRQQQGEETLTEKLMEQRLGQTQMTPLARLMYNMRQQQGEETLTEKLMQQLLGESEITPMTYLMNKMGEKQAYNQWNQQVQQQWRKYLPQQWTQGQVVPQQWTQGQVVPQQWTQGQVVPQQVLNQLVGLERLMQQGQILPQELNMLQHYQTMMMMH